MISGIEKGWGISTGSCAAAAALAAVILLEEEEGLDRVELLLPGGQKIEVEIKYLERMDDNSVTAVVVKNAGKDPDVTNGIEIRARVYYIKEAGIHISGGPGVGVVTRPGLQVEVGEAAINPIPRKMICDVLLPFIKADQGFGVEISVPEGEKVAERTFNSRLGIEGGISILGTTGLVRPMSKEAMITSFYAFLNVAKAMGVSVVYLVPGNIGRKAVLRHFAVADYQIIEMSNYVAEVLDRAHEMGFEHIVIAGHPGKLVKLANNEFYTHSAASTPGTQIVAEIAAEEGFKIYGLEEQQTVEGILKSLPEDERRLFFSGIAKRISLACQKRLGKECAVWLCNMQGEEVASYGQVI